MSTKKTAAKKAAKKTSTPAVAAVTEPEKPAAEKAATLIYQVIKPGGTKYKTMNLGTGWTGPLPDTAVAEALVKIGHIQVIGAA